MSATTLDHAHRTSAAPRRPDGIGLSFGRLVRSEWIKLWTVRSTLWVVPLTLLAQVGVAFLMTWATTQSDSSGPLRLDATMLSQSVGFSQLTVVVLAVLTITGEYRTGMIRTTLTADPRRVPALLAKLLVMLVVAFTLTVLGTAVSWVAVQPLLGSGETIDLSSAGMVRVLIGGPLYVTGIALLAFAIGALVRHSAGALAAVLGLLLVVESVFSAIPLRFFQLVGPFLPGRAGSNVLLSDSDLEAMASMAPESPVLSVWQGYGVLIAWGVVLLAGAVVLLRRRDA